MANKPPSTYIGSTRTPNARHQMALNRLRAYMLSDGDKFVRVRDSDTTSGYLADKLVAGAGVALTPQGAGNEWLRLDENVSVADLAELGAISATGLEQGAIRTVQTLLCDWMLDRLSTATPDGSTVVAAVGGGNWVRLSAPAPRWLAQATWYVSSAGSDENDGVTPGTALRHAAEIVRRIGVTADVEQNTTIYILDDCDADDELEIDCISLHNLSITGVRTVAFSGTVTSYSRSFAASNPGTLQCSTWTPSSYVRWHGEITSGASAGAYFLVARDLTSDTARITSLRFDEWADAPDAAPGDTFVIYRKPRLPVTKLVAWKWIDVQDVHLDPYSATVVRICNATLTWCSVFGSCSCTEGGVELYNVGIRGWYYAGQDTYLTAYGFVATSIQVLANSDVQLYADAIIHGLSTSPDTSEIGQVYCDWNGELYAYPSFGVFDCWSVYVRSSIWVDSWGELGGGYFYGLNPGWTWWNRPLVQFEHGGIIRYGGAGGATPVVSGMAGTKSYRFADQTYGATFFVDRDWTEGPIIWNRGGEGDSVAVINVANNGERWLGYGGVVTAGRLGTQPAGTRYLLSDLADHSSDIPVWRAPVTMMVGCVNVGALVAPSPGSYTVNVLRNGSTVGSVALTVAQTHNSSPLMFVASAGDRVSLQGVQSGTGVAADISVGLEVGV